MKTLRNKFFKLRKVGGNALGFSLPKIFLKALNWQHGDILECNIENNKLIIELKKRIKKEE